MCGMCGGGAADPFGALVAGPVRRRIVAESVDRLLPGHSVTFFASGWTVSSQTGSSSVFQTIDALLAFVGPLAARDPRELRDALLDELSRVPTEA